MCTCACVNTYIPIRKYRQDLSTYVCVYVRVCLCVYICIYIYIYIYIPTENVYKKLDRDEYGAQILPGSEYVRTYVCMYLCVCV